MNKYSTDLYNDSLDFFNARFAWKFCSEVDRLLIKQDLPNHIEAFLAFKKNLNREEFINHIYQWL